MSLRLASAHTYAARWELPAAQAAARGVGLGGRVGFTPYSRALECHAVMRGGAFWSVLKSDMDVVQQLQSSSFH